MFRPRHILSLIGLMAGIAAVAYCQQNPSLGEPPVAPGSPSAVAKTIRAASAPQTGSNWYDTSDRTAMRNNWNLVYWPAGYVPSGWTGDVAANIPGTTTQAFKNAVAARIDWFRAMAGVPVGITLDPVYSAKDQQAALMFSANRALDHHPQQGSWINWTPEAAEAAANSNICIGFPDDPGCILAYIADFGSNNYFVGHRRWILYPQTQTMGTGDVPESGPSGNPYPAANALWVFDGRYGTARPATRSGYVAWPPPGFVPYQAVWARWSFSYPNADFTGAAVSMTRGGQSIPVALETVATNYGENTLVWVPENLNPNIYLPPSPPVSDTTYTVHIGNVIIGGTPQTFDYTVVVFDPAIPPAGSTFSFQPVSQNVPAAGIAGTASLTVAPANTTWTAQSTASWLSITTAVSGTGSGSIGWSASPNTNPSPRSASITVAGVTFTVNQDAVPCVYTLSPLTASLPYAGGSGTLVVTSVPQNCPFLSYSWSGSLTITPSVSQGRLQLNYSVGQNPSQNSRQLTITTAGQTFTIVQAGTASIVTVTTNPGGLNVQIGGTTLLAPQTPTWPAGGQFTLNAPSPQTRNGTRYAFQSWSDNGAQSHTVTTPPSGTIYTANYTATGFLLTRNVNPAGGGALAANPASSDGYYPPNTPVQLTAAPAPGYNFISFTDDLSGSANPQTASMGAPRLVTANFSTVPAGFTDVAPADFFYHAVNLMKARGITTGCSVAPLKYCPNDNVTRTQMAIFIVRAVVGGDTFSYSSTPYFADVPANAFGFAWIQKMFELGITAGCGGGNYCPNDTVTRGQMAIFVTRARLGAAADSTFTYPAIPQFSDVPASHPFYKWIQRIKVDSITAGCGNGSAYCPDDLVTRGQMAMFIMRGAFNYLLPAGQPVLASVTPAAGSAGQAVSVTITGVATHFTAGVPVVSAGPGITVTNVVANQDNTLTAVFAVAANAAPGPRTILVTTGLEEAILPNGFSIL
jgi:hypothetical protein